MQQFTPVPSRVHNFRDLGGHTTSSGRKVKRGMLYRSGVMSGLDDEDRDALRELNVVAIFDLRDNAERDRRPTDWHIGTDTAYHFRDYEQSLAEWSVALKTGQLTAEQSLEMISGIYETLPFEQSASYKALFGLLLDRRVPLLFNCTAGKDRTGVAAALILYALGVDVECIAEDYRLSNLAVEGLMHVLRADPANSALARISPDSLLPMMRAEAHYLDMAFEAIRHRFGSIESYLKAELGVGRSECEWLQEMLLEAAD